MQRAVLTLTHPLDSSLPTLLYYQQIFNKNRPFDYQRGLHIRRADGIHVVWFDRALVAKNPEIVGVCEAIFVQSLAKALAGTVERRLCCRERNGCSE